MKRKRWRLKDDAHALMDTRHVKPVPSRDYLLNFLTESGELASDDATLRPSVSPTKNNWRGFPGVGCDATRRPAVANRNGEYGLVDNMELIRGVVLAYRDGYGFLQPDDAALTCF